MASEDISPQAESWLERWFHVRERGSDMRTEILGGATTFAAMAYIIVVNPAILSAPGATGIPRGPCTVATILAVVFGTLLMGLYANRPLAVAPYMGENAFIAFSLAFAGIAWQERLGTVFVSGILFLVITVLRLRTWLANSISPSMKHSFVVGIGLFLTFIGLYLTGIVTSFVEGMPAQLPLVKPADEAGKVFLGRPDVPVKIGDWKQPKVLLAIFGFLVIVVLMVRRIRGAILVGIILTAVVGYLVGQGPMPEPIDQDYDLGRIAFQLKIAEVLRPSFLPVLLTLFLISFLDTLGTLIGVGATGNMLDEQGNFPQIERPMIVDALSCIFSSLVGTSTSGAFIESAAGVREGARTGLAAITIAVLFALCLFFLPLLEPLQRLGYAYGPALIAVGLLMMGSAARIDFADMTEAVPAFVTIVMMIFTFNIADGLTAGLALYPVMKLAAGRWRDLNGGSITLGIGCLAYYVFGVLH